MLKLIGKWLLSCGVIFSVMNSFAIAAPHKIIDNYSSLLTALTAGDEVRAILTINKCTLSSGASNSGPMVGGLNFTQFNNYQANINDQKKSVIATSTTMLIETPRFGPVYNYVRLRVFEDGSAEVFTQFIDPSKYTQLSSASFNCRLSNGNDQNAIVLYNKD